MEPTILTVHIVTAALELSGLFLVAREVRRGHRAEHAAKDWEFVRRMQFHYASRNWAGLLLEARLDEGDTPEKAQRWLAAIDSGSGNLEKAGREFWAPLESFVAHTLRQWDKEIAKRRKRDLRVGTGLLMLAAVSHLVHSLGLTHMALAHFGLSHG